MVDFGRRAYSKMKRRRGLYEEELVDSFKAHSGPVTISCNLFHTDS